MASAEEHWLKPEPATQDIQKICSELKRNVEGKTGKIYEKFTATEYRDCGVIPRQMLIKVDVGGEYIHLLIDVFFIGIRFPLKYLLVGVEEHHTKDDPLKPFKPNI